MEKNVFIYPCADYSHENINLAYKHILEESNLLNFVKKDMKVGIKLNLVTSSKPEKAVTTNPILVIELCKLLIAKGAIVTIGDSPGNLFTEGVLKSVYKETGMNEVLNTGAKLNFNVSTSKCVASGQVLHSLDVSDWLLEQDVLINFAKLKSHGMMSLSASVKNMFGCVPGILKPEYHYRYPSHPDFANMLIDLNEHYKPVLNILDAVIGMEGNGPTQGDPRFIGLLMASKSPYAIDLVASKIIGLEKEHVHTLNESIKRGLVPDKIEDLNLSYPIEEFIIKDFKNILPGKNMEFNKFKGPFGKLISKFIQKVLTTKPKVKKNQCVGCKVCANICPVKAITMKNKVPSINRKVCIRCFCCQEFCPKGAMKVNKNLLVKLLTRSKRSKDEK